VVEDLSRLIDSANAPIFGIDATGIINEWNVKAAHMTGRSKDEVVRKESFLDFISLEHRAPVQKVLSNALNGIATSDFELTLSAKSGEYHDLLLNANPRRDGRGIVYGVVLVGQDITERKKALQNLHLVAVELRRAEGVALHAATDSARLIETANAPIFGIDRHGMVNEWNRKAAEITGRRKEEVLGKHLVNNFISSEFRDAVKAVFDDALAGISTSDFEFPLFKDTGERVDVLLSANSRIDESKNVIGVVGVGQVRHCLIQ
jgi:PAS domain S-box-containing protein